jgi:hypothetical protein
MKDFKIWMNGKLVSQADAVLPVNSAAVFYATNVFEGLRAYWNPADGELYARTPTWTSTTPSGTCCGVTRCRRTCTCTWSPT